MMKKILIAAGVLVVVLALLAVPMASLRVAAAVPTVEIAPNVFMPLILDMLVISLILAIVFK